MEELFEKELRLKSQHFEEDVKLLVRCAQRCALDVVFDHFMKKVDAIEHLTLSAEYHNIAHLAQGEKFIRLQDAWFNAHYKARFYAKIAEEIYEIQRTKYNI